MYVSSSNTRFSASARRLLCAVNCAYTGQSENADSQIWFMKTYTQLLPVELERRSLLLPCLLFVLECGQLRLESLDPLQILLFRFCGLILLLFQLSLKMSN